ncbi:MAG: DUF6880 family protein [Geoalkalibacter sp.]
MADFYTTDHSVFGRCDDSSDHVGNVYRYDACELFASYAKRCIDNLLAKTISDWGDTEPHTVYVEQLRKKHGRKTSFLSRYTR